MKATSQVCAVLLVVSGFLSGCDFFIDADKRIARAESRIAAGEDRAAAIELLNAVRSEPGNQRARILLAEVSLRLGDVQSAEKEIAAAVASGAAPAAIADTRAQIFLAKGEFEALLTQLDTAALVLTEPALSTYRGQALLGLKRLEPAMQSFEKALEVDANWHQARIGLAQSLVAQGRFDSAMQQLNTVVAAQPKNPRAWAMIGTLLLKQGNTKDAIPALTVARASAPGRLDAPSYDVLLSTLVEAYLGAGDLSAAKSMHAELIKGGPDRPLARLLAARIAMAEQNYPSAIAEAQNALKSAPGFLQAKVLLSAALLANGNLNQAEGHLAELIHQAPDSVEARKLLAQTHLRLNRPDRAAPILESINASHGDSAQVDAMLGLAKLESGDEEAAIALMEKSLRAQPENNAVKLDLALAYLRAGKNENARTLLRSIDEGAVGTRRDALLIAAAAAEGGEAGAKEVERAVAANPKSIEILNIAASYFGQSGNYARSRAYLKRALDIDSANASTLMNAAHLELSAGETDAAKEMLRKAIAANPNSSAARTALAQLAFHTGQQDEGVRLLEEVRRSDPTASEARLLLAAIYSHQDKRREADELIREASTSTEDKGAISSAIGRLLLQSGRYDEALPRLREAIQYDASNPEYRMNLASAQQALGNHDAARESINKALSLRPDWIVPNASLVMLDVREGRIPEARARLDQLKNAHPNDPSISVLEGDVALTLRSYQDAARAYARAFALNPSGAIATREYGARRLAKMKDAAAPLSAWLASHPEDVSLRLMLAEDFASRGMSRDAMEQYELIARGARPNAMALNNLAWMYFEAKDPRAESTAKKAYDLASHVPAIADTYGWILVRGGKAEEGLTILKAAAASPAVAPDIRYHYAAALNEVGNKGQAREELRSLLQTGKPFVEADAARQLLSNLGG
jgi:cellulose synthase operon protein C